MSPELGQHVHHVDCLKVQPAERRRLRPYLSVPLSNHHTVCLLGDVAFVHQAQKPADLHEHIGIFRRGKRSMREQTWVIAMAPGCHHPSVPERGANLPTTCYWALQRHVDTSHAYARCAQVCTVIPELADHTQEIEL